MAIGENTRNCVVIGGGGFVGKAVVMKLLELGNWIVRIADSGTSPVSCLSDERDSLLSNAISSGRASYVQVDVRDLSQIVIAVEGSPDVFYTNAAQSYEAGFYLSHQLIVQGAKNVIEACRKCKVKRLIYCSSADVVFDGSHDIINGDESLPYPWKFQDMLSDLKAQAEALILFANDNDGLMTCSLRPSNIFGPGDRNFISFLVQQAESGWSKYIIGSGENLSDFTYVGNVAHAIISAQEALDSHSVSVAGKAFFITNNEPVKIWAFVSDILEALGYQRPIIKLPARVVSIILSLVDWMHEKSGAEKNCFESAKNLVKSASCTRTFNCSAAQKHIGYSPPISMEEGIAITIDSFTQSANGTFSTRCTDFCEQSKVDKLLGGGKVADILLWRDETKTFTCFLTLGLLYYWFCLSQRTLISSFAELLLLVAVFLCGHGNMPLNIYGFSIQRISSSYFEISENVTRDLAATMACSWNEGAHIVRLLAKGENWSTFLKVAVCLYFLKLYLSYSFSVVLGVALVFVFTSFYVYEQYEEEIDGIAKLLFVSVKKSMELIMKSLRVSFGSNLPDDLLHEQNALFGKNSEVAIQQILHDGVHSEECIGSS
ncbi:3-beta hydroxysteroid dehydrogenase/isomerase [Dillenia turbinata]|uniref:Reticulon-like protein n=1 Tax=Dillenia turbinata TaxID=194707 RepID=A0AAN8Z8E2_9MAGN